MPEPVWNFHSSLPVLASSAMKKPRWSPVKTRPPLVASTPANSGSGFGVSQSHLRLATSIALRCPISSLVRYIW